MFKPNKTSLNQPSFFTAERLLPRKHQELLANSWSRTFRYDVFARSDEHLFAVLYSDEASRPNAPINVLVGAEIIKAGLGLSDRQLANEMVFDIQVRYALGLDDLTMEAPELRTIYNWRRVRCAEATGRNLFQEVFEQVTGEQLEELEVKTEWQRLDSTQMLSNLARMNRLEVVISVVQKLWRHLEKSAQARWQEVAEPYVTKRPYQVCQNIKSGETHAHLWRLGKLLAEWAEMATEGRQPDLFAKKERALLKRVLDEQFAVATVEGGTCVRVRDDAEIAADSLQSAYDEEATYRVKSGEAYHGGYVAGVSETCAPENQLQLITDVQVAPNATDDADLLERSLDSQAEREIEVNAVTADGGYTGEVADEACERHDVELRATNMRGGESRSDTFEWERYEWRFDEEGRPASVRCPKGEEAILEPGRGEGRYIARFAEASCAACPFYKNGCRVANRARGPSLYVSDRIIATATRRQRLRPEDLPVRAVVEATIRSVKHPFRRGKLPVRGLVRAAMMVCASAFMVNLRRIQKYRREEDMPGYFGAINWLFWHLRTWVSRMLGAYRSEARANHPTIATC